MMPWKIAWTVPQGGIALGMAENCPLTSVMLDTTALLDRMSLVPPITGKGGCNLWWILTDMKE